MYVIEKKECMINLLHINDILNNLKVHPCHHRPMTIGYIKSSLLYYIDSREAVDIATVERRATRRTWYRSYSSKFPYSHYTVISVPVELEFFHLVVLAHMSTIGLNQYANIICQGKCISKEKKENHIKC